MAKESTLLHLDLHCWKLSDPMGSVHLYLSTTDGQHLEAAHIWKSALHGTTPNGRNVDLGHLRELAHRPSHSAYTFHHCAKNDERTTAIPPRCLDSLCM